MNHEDLQPLSSGLSSLLAAERDRPALPSSDRERMFERLSATVAAAGLGDIAGQASSAAGNAAPAASTASAASGAAGTAAGAGAASGWLLAKVTALGLGAFLAGGAVVAATGQPLDAATATHAHTGIAASVYFAMPPRQALTWAAPVAELPAHAENPRVDSELDERMLAEAPRGAGESALTAKSGGAGGASPAAPADADEALAAERAVLRRAFSAMSQGRWSSAIAALEEHARQFPSGRLREQREAMMVQALRGSGKGAEAAERGQAFEREYPGSLLIENDKSPKP